MKNRVFPTLFSVLALLFLAACTKQTGSDRLPTPTTYETPTPKPSPTAIPEPPFTEVDISKLSGTPVADSVLTKLTPFSFETSYFFITEKGLLVALASDAILRKRAPLMVGTIDLATGEQKEYTISCLTSPPDAPLSEYYVYYAYELYPIGENFLLVDSEAGDYFLLNESFEKIDLYHIDTPGYETHYYLQPLEDGRVVMWNYDRFLDDYPIHECCFFSSVNGKLQTDIRKISVPDGTKIQDICNIDTKGHATLLMRDGTDAPDADADSYSALYDFNTNTVTRLPVADTTSVYTLGDRVLLWDHKDQTVSVYSLSEPNLKKSFSVPKGSYPYSVSEDGTLLLFENDENYSLYQYSYETGELLFVLELPEALENSYLYSVGTFGKTIFFTANNSKNSENIDLFCGAAKKQEPASVFSALLQTIDYARENNQLISRIQNQYGIPIFIRKDAVRYNSDYFMVAECDESTIYQALTALNETFAAFPEGFFTELFRDTDSFSSIEIYLTADIRQNPNNANTLTTAGGFVTTAADGVKTMTVDITDSGYKKTFAHEFMHIIEESMRNEAYSSSHDYDIFCRMEYLNPEGFDYFYSYQNYYGSDYAKYCGNHVFADESGTVPDNIYFVDDYCFTYPGEDIARIFETLLCTPDNDVPAYIYSDPFQKKAAYVCACIRENFDCITDATDLPWERFLTEKLPLDYFKEHYELIPMG